MAVYRSIFVLILILLLPLLPAQADRLSIVTTTTQATDLAIILTRDVDGLSITPLMGAGVDPHLYQPTESDITAMNDADLIVYSGLHLEGQFDTIFESLNEQGMAIFSLAAPVKNAGFIVGGFDLSETLVDVDDPHFWFEPRNWEISTLALAEALAALDPDHAGQYLANAEAYVQDLRALFAWVDDGLRSVPAEQRDLVSSHDAFGYFGAAFDWQVYGIQGLSTQDEAGVGDIQATVDFVVDNAIPVLFVESSIPPDTIQAVVEAVEDAGGEVRAGVRELYSDAMGEPGTFGGTYIGMIAENTLTILQSYQCAGVELHIPPWPDALLPAVPDDILNAQCD